MYHCCRINSDEIYYLEDTEICTNRVLSVGFCPICKKPVAELTEFNFAGGKNITRAAGINAQNLMLQLQKDIICSRGDTNYRKVKSKPYGWKYGVNKNGKNGKIYQYSCDFYGNKELIKKL